MIYMYIPFSMSGSGPGPQIALTITATYRSPQSTLVLHAYSDEFIAAIWHGTQVNLKLSFICYWEWISWIFEKASY